MILNFMYKILCRSGSAQLCIFTLHVPVLMNPDTFPQIDEECAGLVLSFALARRSHFQ
jgi:hypothetical protein